MIYSLSIRYQKSAAWLLFVVFYVQTIFPVSAFPVMNYRAIPVQAIKAHTNNPPLFKKDTRFTEGLPVVSEQSATENVYDHLPDHRLKYNNIPSSSSGPGPGQPEMQSFQSVNTTNMVDLFTGDFSYNIPLLDVGGYPVNIHYTGGISMDQEASWVGLGWNINPGTISRSMRGIPDDFNGQDTISRIQHVKPNQTAGVTVGGDVEIVGLPVPAKLGVSMGIFNNNYNGWGIENGINASINSGDKAKGPLSGGLSLTNNSQTGFNVNPSIAVKFGKEEQTLNGKSTLSTNFNSRMGLGALQLKTEVRMNVDFVKKLSNALKTDISTVPVPASVSFATPSYIPTINMPYTSTQYSFTAKVGTEYFTVHPNVYISGYVSMQEIKPEDTHQSLPAYGYLYYSLSNNTPGALLDVNREKETQFNASTSPLIAIPQYTYDLYSISGEGTGGMFRPYRGDVGYVGDHAMRTKSNSVNASLDFGAGALFHGGTDVVPIIANTQSGIWENASQNAMNKYIRFQKSDSTFQEVFFRNPGEKTSNAPSYYNAIGDEALVRVKLEGTNSNILASNKFTIVKGALPVGETVVNTTPVKDRDKRTQVITYLTADEARQYGLDKTIKSYAENSIPSGTCSDDYAVIPRTDNIRKKHHLSEINVINNDGRRYVYGLPAYNIMQKEVTFSVDKETDKDNINKGLVSYTPGVDNSIRNGKGKESYFTQDSLPGFAHSFLLTGILSPDYVDVTGDGITEDDLGDAIKFNYTEVYGSSNNYFDWRAPFEENKANYSEGLKTYNRDDKGNYLYGKKEVWYLNSIESKTMIAVFKIKNDRLDSKAVKGENGGYDLSKGLRRLDKIELFTKADLIENGDEARPVKTVHFAYSYRLCPGGGSGENGAAKLTLDSIWFSYNGNNKGKLNPYVFQYSPDENGEPKEEYNPAYNARNYDRWGNYKDTVNNPGNMNNADYPYSVQDSAVAAQNAAAWQLTDIQLPSSGRLKITYEADDYAYVQNKRAMQLFQIAGFGEKATSTPSNLIYASKQTDHYYLFINSAVPLNDVADLRVKYFGNNDTLYFKVAVNMPADKWGDGYELVPGYGVIDDMGISNHNSNQFWVRLKPVDGQSPVTKAAIQFLRLNLPSKAYPGSEVGNDPDFIDLVKMLVSSTSEILNVVLGFDNMVKVKNLCKSADLSKSFVRLTNPEFKKYGGGSRVKRVELFDNWNKMTGQKEAVYGQEYSYTTTEEVNGITQTISSGVASYEPPIGNDENPFRQPISYAEKLAPLAPVNYLFAEEPVGESFFPSASVGYSRVVVRTINHKAKSANGWDETTFYTTKDFPTLVDYTLLDDHAKKQYKPALRNLLKIDARHYLTLSQGFRIQLNDMNGRIKSQASYPETDSLHPINATYYFYKENNQFGRNRQLINEVPVIDSLNGHINPHGIIGKDIEVMVDMREQTSNTFSKQFSPNVDVIPFFWFPLPVPSGWPLPQWEETKYRSVATVKIIHRYGILDSMVVMDKGSIVSTKNLVYDGETGEVIVSRINNEFNDAVYNFNYPAYWAYSGMGPAYQNTGAVFYHKNLMSVNGKLYYADRRDFPASQFFESGDELWVRSGTAAPYDPNCTVNHVDISGKPKKLWVMDAAKAGEGGKGLFLIDAAGLPYSGVIDSLKVIRSGRRNILQASAGSIVSLANPVRETSPGNYKIVIDTASRVINTSATAYKDLWKVENSLYQKDTVVQVYKTFTAYPQIDATVFRQQKVNTIEKDLTSSGENVVTHSPNIGATFEGVPAPSCGPFGVLTGASINMSTKTILSFDTTSIPAGAQIISATLSLSPKVPIDLWWKKNISRDPCSGYTTYDWSMASNYYLGTSGAKLSRLEANWNYATPYNSFQVSTLHQVSLDQSNYTQLDCTSLIQDMFTNNTRFGMMLELAQKPNGVSFLNFCAGNQPNVNNVNNANCTPSQSAYRTEAAADASSENGIPCDCYAPVLQITYKGLVDSTYQVCRQNIVDSATNPYRWGMLGNWRADRAYTYYSNRVESDAADTITNIRTEGTIADFSPFWKMTDSVLLASPDTSKWVWNSAGSLYNRKGFELENYDPLGRYNSGLYGYHETLPVTVSQNGKYRQTLFDGFEDYSYKAQNCTLCPSPREFDFTKDNSQASVTDNQSHTGLYSLKVNAGFQAGVTVPVVSPATDTSAGYVGFKIDSTAIYDTVIVGKGTGLKGDYYGYKNLIGSFYCGNDVHRFRVDTVINFNWGAEPPFAELCNVFYTVTWEGFIQAPLSGNYTFWAEADYMVSLKIDNQILFTGAQLGISAPIKLAAGVLYPVTFQYTYSNSQNAVVSLLWTTPGTSLQLIPKKFLYPEGIIQADTLGSVVTHLQKWCVSAGAVKQNNLIRPAVSPVQGDHLILSGWARIDDANCYTMPAAENVIQVSFNNGGAGTPVSLKPTGVKIEGWQRYEGEVNVPTDATLMNVIFSPPSGYAIFLDDIRMEPFNGSSKAFVYHPGNLRLMAELDENNYATFYEYDDDGTLIRIKKETERGIMTLQETRSALIKEP